MPRVIPFGDTILVKRRKVGTTLINGKTLGGLHIPESAEGRNTDLADVTYVPDITFSDKEILDNSESIVKALTKKATNGNVDALNALARLPVTPKPRVDKRIEPRLGEQICLQRFGFLADALGELGNVVVPV